MERSRQYSSASCPHLRPAPDVGREGSVQSLRFQLRELHIYASDGIDDIGEAAEVHLGIAVHGDAEHLGDDALGEARSAPLIGMGQDIAAPAGNRDADPALKGNQFDLPGAGVQGAEHVAVRSPAEPSSPMAKSVPRNRTLMTPGFRIGSMSGKRIPFPAA